MDFITFTVVLLVGLLIVTNLLALWWLGYLLLPYLNFGGPYVPTSRSRVEEMVKKAELKSSDRIVDLGSGDGRIVIAAAKEGVAEAVGYEIHAGLVKASKLKAKAEHVADRAHFVKKSFWGEPLGGFSVVFMFQIPFAMKRMSSKLLAELPSGARIVSNGYKIPGLSLINSDHGIYLYKKP